MGSNDCPHCVVFLAVHMRTLAQQQGSTSPIACVVLHFNYMRTLAQQQGLISPVAGVVLHSGHCQQLTNTWSHCGHTKSGSGMGE